MVNDKLLARLKKDTLVEHQKCEATFPLFGEHTQKSEYKAYLESMHKIYTEIEEHILRHQETLPAALELEKRCQKRLWIEQDLNTLQTDATPPHSKLNLTESSLAGVMGYLYVLEGATLGGQIISKRLKQSLNLDDNQLNFFSGYGPQTGPMWKNFTKVAEENLQESDYEILLRSANQVFQIIAKGM